MRREMIEALDYPRNLILTLIFGLGAIFVSGGFAAYGPIYHTSLLLVVGALGVHFGIIRPAWDRIETAVQDGNASIEEADSARSRLSMGVGINHLLWFVVIVLMLWNQYLAPAFAG